MGPMRKAALPAPAPGSEGRMLYFAYGSNLSIETMQQRCPAARPLYPLRLLNSKLVFRAGADIAYKNGEECPGGVWSITPECEKALDAIRQQIRSLDLELIWILRGKIARRAVSSFQRRSAKCW